ncbi:selenide, water dikinase SelD [Motiliproteus sediminis]|uniref:selenide, water dikinase SelD n=1 Tax=Motiliproteus sediminis TaxID=1468178 RepID=UPI001AEFC73F|nr:selenide, water dikinase SelD [Motiliproteus sediminis]
MSDTIRLTEYSHGAGCGCKIAPNVLETILKSSLRIAPDPNLLVGNSSKDDAAVYDLGNGTGVISTTDFFMPIVDDPFDFGRIAATNAISDIYAMGGRPLMAIAILGWPVNTLPIDVAAKVVDGGRQACADAGIQLAGGHSIDAPEPIFGLAVTGQVELARLKRNDTATAGCTLYLTKPLGVGILTTAQKQKKLMPQHAHIARDAMCQLNKVGADIAAIAGVTALTDVTGFGLLGHLLEMCEGSGVHAQIDFDALPRLEAVDHYLALGCTPGGTDRNFASYGHNAAPLSDQQRALLCDPQTSGGLLVAVTKAAEAEFLAVVSSAGLDLQPIGQLVEPEGSALVTLGAAC